MPSALEMIQAKEIADLLKGFEHPALNAIDLSLLRIQEFLKKIGNPERQLPPIVHIAGTNGKGSTLAHLRYIAKAAGLRAHAYISPHLVTFNERIIINHEPVQDAMLLDALRFIRKASEGFPLTFFEATTAAAFHLFARHPAELLLLETGMGGRLDATNVCIPALTCITPIGMDHTEFLGNTLEDIAAEKAGIIKAQIPCIVGAQATSVQKVIEAKATMLNAPVMCEGTDWHVQARGENFDYVSPLAILENLSTALVGAHQHANAALAITCAIAWPHHAFSEDVIREGLLRTEWPGRLQRLTHAAFQKFLGQDVELWLDGGHNPHAATIIAQWLEHHNQPTAMIVGMMQGKDASGFFSCLKGNIKTLYTVPVEGHACIPPHALASLAAQQGFEAVACSSLQEAFKHLSQDRRHALILIAGSLYLAGNVLAET